MRVPGGVLLFFLLAPAAIFASTPAEREKLTYDLSAAQSDLRLSAVRQLALSNDDSTAKLLGQQLLLEKNSQIIELLLAYFKQRQVRTDFFYLSDFLPRCQSPRLCRETISYLYSVQAQQLQYELEKLFAEDDGKIFSFYFLQAINRPSADDLLWLDRCNRQYDLPGYWLGLTADLNSDEMMSAPLQPYASTLKGADHVAAIYWQWLLAGPSGGLEPALAELLPLLSPLQKKRLLRRWPASLDCDTPRADPDWRMLSLASCLANSQKKEEFWQSESNLYVLMAALAYIPRASAAQKEPESACPGQNQDPFFCQAFWLSRGSAQSWSFWQKQDEAMRLLLAEGLLGQMLAEPAFKRAEFLHWLLARPGLGKRLPSALPDDWLETFASDLAQAVQKPDNFYLRQLWLARIREKPGLREKYLPLWPELSYYLTEQPE